MTDTRVMKTCGKCHRTQMALPRERRCKRSERNLFGATGYSCWGKLTSVPRKKKARSRTVPVPAGLGIGHVLTAEYQENVRQQRGDDGRATAAKQLEKAKAKQKAWMSEAKRIDTLCRKWTKVVRRLSDRTTWTDEKFEQERQRAAKAAQVSHVKRRLSKAAGTKEQHS